MRGAARGLIVAVAAMAFVGAGAPCASGAASDLPPYYRAIHDLDGAQFLEDEPIWICDDALVPLENLSSTTAARARNSVETHRYRLIGVEDLGKQIRAKAGGENGFRSIHGASGSRAGEFVSTFNLPVRPEFRRLFLGGGLRAGRYEVRRLDSDTARVIARFQVIAPRGSELAVRAALARAARLFSTGRFEEAGRLYEAILSRYPRTSYRTEILLGLFNDLARPDNTKDPGAWLTEIFANFHDTCFGIYALDQYMEWCPPNRSVPLLRKLVGLYPDTRLARAAALYL